VTDALKKLSPVRLPDETWSALERAYRTPPRHYHTLEHILEVAQTWASLEWKEPAETFLAVLFHDAVYVVGQPDNEGQSAQLCEQLTVRHPRAAELIRLTARHGHLSPKDVDEEAAHFLDCDMAILGSDPERFARYEQQIAREYLPVVGEEAYQLGRRRFLEGLLARERIFLSEHFHQKLDAAARRNLRGAL
jgi:predicted metal-dependent HD superfamily phosphohydrolase